MVNNTNTVLAPNLELPPLQITDNFEALRSDIGLRLLPGESIINIETPAINEPSKHPSATRELMRLTGVTLRSEIGNNGPSNAARATEGNMLLGELRLYEEVFGRDSLIVAKFAGEKYPKLMRTTVMHLAQYQGMEFNTAREEEPGRITHELRDPKTDKIAQQLTAERGWGWPYYGSVDATPLFVSGIASVVKKQGIGHLKETYIDRNSQEATMENALDRSVGWIMTKLSQNPEGLLEFKRTNPNGIENPVWKDSWDSYFHADGKIANHDNGIASIEVQSLAYDALLDAIEIYELTGNKNKQHIAALKAAAANLKTQVMDKFWIEDERGGYFALGTDRDEQGNLRQLKVRTSNMGHVLNSRLLEGDDPEIVRKREAVISTLFSEEMLATPGIRTLSCMEFRYRPGSYHNGSVWLWDNYFIAQGLERHGYNALALDLKKRMRNVIDKSHKFPEYVRGENTPVIKLNTHIIDIWDEINNMANRLEQPPQEVQAWTVAAMLAAKVTHQPLLFIKNSIEKMTQATPLIAKKREFEENIITSLAA